VEAGRGVTALERDAAGSITAVVADGGPLFCDAAILTVPWRAAARLVPDVVPPADERLAGSPITAVG
jgi:protoporphyrinogen oxidase